MIFEAGASFLRHGTHAEMDKPLVVCSSMPAGGVPRDEIEQRLQRQPQENDHYRYHGGGTRTFDWRWGGIRPAVGMWIWCDAGLT